MVRGLNVAELRAWRSLSCTVRCEGVLADWTDSGGDSVLFESGSVVWAAARWNLQKGEEEQSAGGAVAGLVVGDRCEDNGVRSQFVTVLRTRNLKRHALPADPLTSVRSPAATSASTSAAPARSPGRPALTLAMFEKARFGGTLSAAAKPNVNLTRRPVEPCHSPGWEKHSMRYPTSSDAPFQSQILQACLPFLSASIQPCHVGGEDQLFSSGCIRYESCSSSQTVLDQLSLALRGEFRLILTRKYACDIRVIRMLRERTLGNSSTRLAKQLRENHGEEWLQRLARYMELANDFARRPSLFPVVCQRPPEPIAVPTNRWLLTVYGKDLMSRMGHIKASITSTFGSILKMDSTKKMTKKLAGAAKGTALWVSSVSNEKGQVLISVLTAQEGPGLDRMVTGLIRRYSEAGVAPPILLYADCGCCKEAGGESELKARFSGWPDLVIRLDAWHFLRRLAAGCTTDAHALYPVFMAMLSVCLFEWDPEDVALLHHAKREELRREGVPGISEALVDS
ncbi:unnamed protein product [Gadus morhua 'NCC']